MKKPTLLLLILITMLALSACKSKKIVDEPLAEVTAEKTADLPETDPSNGPEGTKTEEPYPIIEEENTYPAGGEQEKYPIADDSVKQGPKFTIDEPVTADAKVVTGTGPAGVPIRLVDVSLMGQELALITIGEDGKFTFELEEDLVPGHSIGLMIGDLSETDFNYDEFMYSDEYYDKPMVGTVFYIAIVGN